LLPLAWAARCNPGQGGQQEFEFMIFANGDSSAFVGLVVVILVIGGLCKIWMVIYRPDLVKAQLEEQRHKREQRNRVLGPVVGTGARVFGWWLTRR
jgi:hypothetical protein